MTIHSKADVRLYRFKASNTLDAAFAGATAMFDARRGADFKSITIRRRRIGFVQQSRRGLTHIHYDPQDYQGGAVPPDAHISFVRVAEVDNAGVARPDGPILIVPTPTLMSMPRPPITLSGTAPAVAALPTLLPPPGSMHFVFPRYTNNVKVTNTSGVSILLSFDAGQPEVELLTGETHTFYDITTSEVFIRGDGAPATFTMVAALVNGVYE